MTKKQTRKPRRSLGQKTHRSLGQKPHSSYDDQTRPAVTAVTSQPNGDAVTALLLKLSKLSLSYNKTHTGLYEKSRTAPIMTKLDLLLPL